MLTESVKTAALKVSGKLTCESCGVEFFCGANIGKCWCFAVNVEAETLADLRENFKNCLCENCLPINEHKINEGNLSNN